MPLAAHALASDLDCLGPPAQRKQEPREIPELIIEAFPVR